MPRAAPASHATAPQQESERPEGTRSGKKGRRGRDEQATPRSLPEEPPLTPKGGGDEGGVSSAYELARTRRARRHRCQ